jgi:hypothetical protein
VVEVQHMVDVLKHGDGQDGNKQNNRSPAQSMVMESAPKSVLGRPALLSGRRLLRRRLLGLHLSGDRHQYFLCPAAAFRGFNSSYLLRYGNPLALAPP